MRDVTTMVVLLACTASTAGAQWVTQASGTTAELRGVSAVSARVAWASGSRGTVLRTTDGGASWHAAPMPGADSLDFRDVEAFDSLRAVVLSAIARINRELQTTTAVITHNAVIGDIADRVLALADGRIVSDRHNEHPRMPQELHCRIVSDPSQ